MKKRLLSFFSFICIISLVTASLPIYADAKSNYEDGMIKVNIEDFLSEEELEPFYEESAEIERAEAENGYRLVSR